MMERKNRIQRYVEMFLVAIAAFFGSYMIYSAEMEKLGPPEYRAFDSSMYTYTEWCVIEFKRIEVIIATLKKNDAMKTERLLEEFMDLEAQQFDAAKVGGITAKRYLEWMNYRIRWLHNDRRIGSMLFDRFWWEGMRIHGLDSELSQFMKKIYYRGLKNEPVNLDWLYLNLEINSSLPSNPGTYSPTTGR